MSSKGPALNELDKHKQLSTKCCVNVDRGPKLILSKRWVTRIVIIIMQPFFVECRLCKYVIIQQASIKSDNISLKKAVDH